jgi:mannose-6-phosphate isomerase-like protein (cupin superfamily)
MNANCTPVPGYPMDRCVSTYAPERSEPVPAGHQYWFADRHFAGGNTVKLSAVGPGRRMHEPHRHAEDEFMFVLEGTGEFTLDDETRVVGPLTSLYCPSWHLHGLRNCGDTVLKYLVLRKEPLPATAGRE